MPATARKKPAIVETERADDPLLAAIHADFVARNTADEIRKSIRAATDRIMEAESRLESFDKVIAKARENDATRAAVSIAAGRDFTAAQTSKAEAAREEQNRLIEVATSARDKLRGNLRVAEDDAAETLNAKIVIIKERSLDLAVQLVERLEAARRETCICVRVLSELVQGDEAKNLPVFHDQMRARRAEEKRDGVFAGIKERVSRVLFGPSDQDHLVALEVSKEVKAALVGMQTNALHQLPKV